MQGNIIFTEWLLSNLRPVRLARQMQGGVDRELNIGVHGRLGILSVIRY